MVTRIASLLCLTFLLLVSALEGQESQPKAGFVRPPANPAKITPSKAADKAEIKLPGVVDMTCFGGGGRYVLLRIPSAKQVAVLDLCEGKLVKYIAIAEEGALIAAGNEHLFILNPRANVIQRWNLKTLEKEATVANPLGGTPQSLVIGHATDGPLFVVGPNRFLDGKTFKEVSLEGKEGETGMKKMAFMAQSALVARISADGRVLAWHSTSGSPWGLASMIVGDEEVKYKYEHDTVGAIIPGPDGTLFTPGGIFAPNLKRVGGNKRWQYWNHAPIPAAHGDWYLSISPSDTPIQQKEEPKISLMRNGEERVVADLSELEGFEIPKNYNPSQAKDLPPFSRIFLVPDAEVLAVLNGAGVKVVLHKFDVPALLDKSGVDYLLVTSRPAGASRGESFTYRPKVASKKGGVKVKLDAGPDGMKIGGDGTVTWDVPKTFAEDSASVILTISDRSGQEIFHTFSVRVSNTPKKSEKEKKEK
jgi:hypothetical protein